MWEYQVELPTRHTQKLTSQVWEMEGRLVYLEGVMATLLEALKEGGVIVEADENDPDTPTYEV